MRILALESSARAASAAVCGEGALIAQYFQASGLTHSRTLLSMVGNMLNNTGLSISDMDGIAVASGPGSFTGIRIGVSAAKGLAWGSGLPVCGVSTLEAMAYMCPRDDVIICPVMDARREQIYNAKFRLINGKPERLCPDRAISLTQLAEEAKSDEKRYFLLGDGALMCYNFLESVGAASIIAPEHLRLQSAGGVCMASLGAKFVSPGDLLPNYLRLSQAERERLQRQNSGK